VRVAHQSAEKAIKGLLAFHDVDPPKLHDLDRLVQRLPRSEQVGFESLELPELTRWAIEGRYPADIDEATGADATKSIGISQAVLALVRSKLAETNDPPADAPR